MTEFKYRVILEDVRNYLVTVYAEDEEKACQILDEECFNWESWGPSDDVVITSNNSHFNTDYTLIEDKK